MKTGLLALALASAWIVSSLPGLRKVFLPLTLCPTAERWTLVWSDEFDEASGSRPDPSKWKLQVGGNGWGITMASEAADSRGMDVTHTMSVVHT